MKRRHAGDKKGNAEVEVTGNKPTGGLQALLEKVRIQSDLISSCLGKTCPKCAETLCPLFPHEGEEEKSFS